MLAYPEIPPWLSCPSLSCCEIPPASSPWESPSDLDVQWCEQKAETTQVDPWHWFHKVCPDFKCSGTVFKANWFVYVVLVSFPERHCGYLAFWESQVQMRPVNRAADPPGSRKWGGQGSSGPHTTNVLGPRCRMKVFASGFWKCVLVFQCSLRKCPSSGITRNPNAMRSYKSIWQWLGADPFEKQKAV